MSGSDGSNISVGGDVVPFGGIKPFGQIYEDALRRMKVFEGGSQIDQNPQFTYAPPQTNEDMFPYIVQALQNARLQGIIGQSPTYSFGAARFLGENPSGANRFLAGQQVPQLTYTAPSAPSK